MVRGIVDIIYNLIPKLDCKGKCWESCGPIDMSDRERELIKEFCEKNGIPYHHIDKVTPAKLFADIVKDDKDLMCPYLVDNKCSIYSVRPLICRLWGVIESMPCLWGCKPKPRMLKESEGHHLLERLET